MLRSALFAGFLLISALLLGFQSTDSWLGKWSGEHPDGVTYTIIVKDKYKGMNLCDVHAQGIQTFYHLECWATGTPTTLKVYYRSTTDGAFYAKDPVKLNQPLFILQREKGKTNWQWQQIFDGKIPVRKKASA
ncbi:hypothetical protein GGR92_001367 [Spirosoma lacussanchae]|uniref:DUF5991 domain-containing protein n=1 Tax=Spirosoma lacussanchae TaxID=1884249 RepID=UPI0011096D6D|nr:DUF5991 domain-containing protein [Spirosoma lacussanchae]